VLKRSTEKLSTIVMHATEGTRIASKVAVLEAVGNVLGGLVVDADNLGKGRNRIDCSESVKDKLLVSAVIGARR
jgi:hypothetical protein